MKLDNKSSARSNIAQYIYGETLVKEEWGKRVRAVTKVVVMMVVAVVCYTQR